MPAFARATPRKAASKPASVASFLAALPADRRAIIASVRGTVNRHLPQGYEETVSSGMIVWQVPLSAFPQTYNGQPLMYVGLAPQKNHNALYLMGAYVDPAQAAMLKKGYQARGLKLDMGKSCLRFRDADDVALDVVGQVVASMPPRRLIALCEASRRK